MGVASDVLSVFARKPIFGYHAMAFSMIGIAFLSWIVWGHHMFQSGMSPALGTSFMLSTMVIAVPSAIRSEEHTSELQSHSDLVCRLLLEKKKNKQYVSLNDH